MSADDLNPDDASPPCTPSTEPRLKVVPITRARDKAADATPIHPVLASMPVRLLAIRRGIDDLLEGLCIDGHDEEDGEHLQRARRILVHVRQLELDVSELGGPEANP